MFDLKVNSIAFGSDGCPDYRQNSAGSAIRYETNSTGGRHPIGSVAYLTCNTPGYKATSSPPFVVCSPEAKWGDSTCWPSTYPLKPADFNRSSQIGDTSGWNRLGLNNSV